MQPFPGALGLGLLRGRVHEFCGSARVNLAAMILRESQGPVIWIAPGWQADRIYSAGLVAYADPARLIYARARRAEDLLWAAEEALRSGAAAIVIAELPDLPGLTPVRRLHLAAETGAQMAQHRAHLPPLGLLLTPGMGGAQGVESRWHLVARPSGTTLIDTKEAWTLSRLRARMAPPASWDVARDMAGQITLSPARQGKHTPRTKVRSQTKQSAL
jgi:protein ImuA